MGPLTWLGAGALAFVISRFLKMRRQRALVEAATALVIGAASGLAATALDFGGWSEADPRAIAFCWLNALAAIALVRLFGRVKAGGDHSIDSTP